MRSASPRRAPGVGTDGRATRVMRIGVASCRGCASQRFGVQDPVYRHCQEKLIPSVHNRGVMDVLYGFLPRISGHDYCPIKGSLFGACREL